MSKTKKSESVQLIESMIAANKHTRQQIIDAYLAKYPERKKSTVATYLSDAKNAKYTAFDFLATVSKKTGVLSFTKQAKK